MLSYLYYDALTDPNFTWTEGGEGDEGLLTDDGKKFVKACAKKIDQFDLPEFSLSYNGSSGLDISIPASEVTLGTDGYAKTGDILYDSYNENRISVKLPDGIFLVKSGSSDRLTGTVKVNGGETFHLEQKYTDNSSYKTSSGIDTEARWFSAGDAIKISTSSNEQDGGLSVVTNADNPSINVAWPNPESYFYLKKTASAPDLVKGNPQYSLAGAVYEVYKSDKSTLLGTITTGAESNGAASTPAFKVNAEGTYYVKEKNASLTMPKPLTVWITINCGKF